MNFSKSKWFTYTLLVGLLPIATRLTLWTAAKPGTILAIAASDVITLGLVLHISIINELEHVADRTNRDSNLKTILNGTSAFFITLYGALYALAIIGEKNQDFLDKASMLKSSLGLASASLLLSLVTSRHLAKGSTK
ncbi:hypothetical protein GTP91_15510 [Rugamonas sp. FT82W]|uniref:Uncharacterized protein n=1 Tax=Duganella vulcania TaxID=2692166 RepID=A0A845G631_9BURK|nr:hypothetical protein [Duganella vulcania]MYM88576.1 hypothetical protein [Duganella vulcania]